MSVAVMNKLEFKANCALQPKDSLEVSGHPSGFFFDVHAEAGAVVLNPVDAKKLALQILDTFPKKLAPVFTIITINAGGASRFQLVCAYPGEAEIILRKIETELGVQTEVILSISGRTIDLTGNMKRAEEVVRAATGD